MFLSSVLHTLQDGSLALLIAVFCILTAVGFLIQFQFCRFRAPVPLQLLPVVICLLALLLLYSFSVSWLPLSLPAYNTLVKGGLLRIWGVCAEGFLFGCLIGWIFRLFDRNIKKK